MTELQRPSSREKLFSLFEITVSHFKRLYLWNILCISVRMVHNIRSLVTPLVF